MSDVKTGNDQRQRGWVLKVLGITLPDDGPDEFVAQDGEDYRAYLLRALRQLRAAGGANFAVVFGAEAHEHRMAFGRRQSGRSLSSKLMGDTGLHTGTWGFAEPHPDKAATLMLTLEGREVPGLRRKGEQMLRLYQPLPMKRIRPLVDGAEAGDAAEAADLSDADGEAGAAEEDEAGFESILDTLPAHAWAGTDRAQSMIEAARSGAALLEECRLPPPPSAHIED